LTLRGVPTVEVAQVEICDDREDDEHDEEGEVTAQAAGVGGGFGGGVEVWSILFKRKRMMLGRGCFVVGGGGKGEGGIEDAYPMMLPTDWPMKTIPLVRERLVWPAVFCAARLYIIGLIAG
jgi:hypothetical protein